MINLRPPGPETEDGSPLVAVNGRQNITKAQKVVQVGRQGSDTTAVSHNFCDPTTWYSQSERVEEEALTTSDNLTYESTHSNWIDIRHGKIYREYYLYDDYDVIIKSDDVEMTMRPPFTDTGGDYTVAYVDGTVTFAESQAGKTVTATYSYANGSAWHLHPSSGRVLFVETGKMVVSTDDWVLNTRICYEVLVGDTVVGYSYWDTVDQMFVEAKNCCGEVDGPVGGPTRGTVGNRRGFSIEYLTTRNLYSSMGLWLRIHLDNDEPCPGTWCTFTLWCGSETES